MAERRLKPSHPSFQRMSELAQMIAVATNPQLFFDGQGEETQDIIDTLKEEMELLLLGGIFADYMEEDADHS